MARGTFGLVAYLGFAAPPAAPAPTAPTAIPSATLFAPLAPLAPVLGRSRQSARHSRVVTVAAFLALAALPAPPLSAAPAPPAPPPPPTPPASATPAAPAAPAALAAVTGVLASTLAGATRLGHRRLRRGLHGHELDAGCEVRVHLHHAHFGNLGRGDGDAGATRAAAEPCAARRHRHHGRRRCGGRGRRGRRRGGVGRLGRLGGRILVCVRGGRLAGAQLHGVRAVFLLREVDDLRVVRLAEQLREPLGFERHRRLALQLDHRIAQFLRAHRLLAAQAAQRLFDQAEALAQGEPAPAPPPTPPPAPAAAVPPAGPLDAPAARAFFARGLAPPLPHRLGLG